MRQYFVDEKNNKKIDVKFRSLEGKEEIQVF